VGDVRADEADPLPAVLWASHLVLHLTHPA
jgi:hypothetical protein